MAASQTTIRRLAFSRFLFRTSISQSALPPPLHCAALLMMHDAVELFLQIASEHLNVGKKEMHLMDYFEALNKRLDAVRLEEQEAMRRLSRARAALKHEGIFPSQFDVQAFRSSVDRFFESNCPLVFGIALDQVSLVEFVAPEEARALLENAVRDIEQGDTLKALDDIAVAFDVMMRAYESQKIGPFGLRPFDHEGDLRQLDSFHLDIGRSRSLTPEQHNLERAVGKLADGMVKSLTRMQRQLRAVSMGLEHSSYLLFRQLTPGVVRSWQGEVELNRHFDEAHAPTVEEARFCLDFAVESALKLAANLKGL